MSTVDPNKNTKVGVDFIKKVSRQGLEEKERNLSKKFWIISKDFLFPFLFSFLSNELTIQMKNLARRVATSKPWSPLVEGDEAGRTIASREMIAGCFCPIVKQIWL